MDVLFDMTPLLIDSRFRGIGHYVVSLARAIDGLSDGEREGLEVRALIDLRGEVGALDWRGYENVTTMRLVPWLMRRRTLLVGALRRLRPSLFHVTQPWGTPHGSGIPRVATCHDLLLHVLHREYLPGRWAYRRFLRAVDAARFHSARRVIAISEFTASTLMTLLRIPAARIDIVPHGVDHGRFRVPSDAAERDTALAALGIDRPYLLNLGGADVRKSIDTLVLAYGKAALADVDLLLVGHYSDSEQARVDEAVMASGAQRGVRRLGFVPEDAVPALFNGALALVFPSLGEGFGLPILEAMASGCPVITTAETALAEVAGDAALFTPPRDVDALADAMRRMVSDEALRRDLSRAGIARAAGYSWEETARRTMASYRRALTNR